MTAASTPAADAAFLRQPDLGARLLGGAIWATMAIGWAAGIVAAILTAPTATAWLIQQGGSLVRQAL